MRSALPLIIGAILTGLGIVLIAQSHIAQHQAPDLQPSTFFAGKTEKG